MLCEVPLTKEQQEFAAEHHGLVYKFLNDNHLPDDEFYDVVIFPYLKAVQDYFSDESAQRYSFAAIVRHRMRLCVYDHFRRLAASATLKSSAFISACTRTACPWRNCCRRRMI